MNAFRLSGEKSAAVAPVIANATLVLFVVSKTNTWLGVAIVSETMTFFPSEETASTLPVTDLTSLSVDILALAPNTISPLVPNSPRSVPRNAFFFQAEDGIRYLTVTGVQTCALPI